MESFVADSRGEHTIRARQRRLQSRRCHCVNLQSKVAEVSWKAVNVLLPSSLLDAIVSSAIQAKSALLVFVKESNLVSFHILLQEIVDGFGQ
jgi:hypothetical protein